MSFSSTNSSGDIRPNEFNAERKRKDSAAGDLDTDQKPR
jgi:hypothetical protein